MWRNGSGGRSERLRVEACAKRDIYTSHESGVLITAVFLNFAFGPLIIIKFRGFEWYPGLTGFDSIDLCK
jgi:hypothetical protein